MLTHIHTNKSWSPLNTYDPYPFPTATHMQKEMYPDPCAAWCGMVYINTLYTDLHIKLSPSFIRHALKLLDAKQLHTNWLSSSIVYPTTHTHTHKPTFFACYTASPPSLSPTTPPRPLHAPSCLRHSKPTGLWADTDLMTSQTPCALQAGNLALLARK